MNFDKFLDDFFNLQGEVPSTDESHNKAILGVCQRLAERVALLYEEYSGTCQCRGEDRHHAVEAMQDRSKDS
jgi:hypothetical protein